MYIGGEFCVVVILCNICYNYYIVIRAADVVFRHIAGCYMVR